MSAFPRWWATMKALIIASFGLQASLSGCGTVDRSRPYPTCCPFGHEELTRVPIVYGLLVMTEDQRRKIDRLEVWPGGCIGGVEEEKLVCKTCRYHFEPLFQEWSKDAADPNLLRFKPDPFIAEWPNGENETNVGRFTQHVRDQSVCGEEFRGSYTLPEKETETLVRRHLAQFAVPFERQERHFGRRHYIEYRYLGYSHCYFVEIMSEANMKDAHVRAVRSVERPYGY